MVRDIISDQSQKELQVGDDLKLPSFSGELESAFSSGKSFQVEGTNVVRVPFGIRRSIKQRPVRPERWATLVLPLQAPGTPPPPQAA